MKIIKTSEALPKSGRYVLAWLEGAKIPMRAMWAAQHTLPLGDDADPEWGEYSEEKDEYFCPAGWYEMNQHEEQHWGVSGNVVAWCELPRLEAGAAPAAVAPQGEYPPLPEARAWISEKLGTQAWLAEEMRAYFDLGRQAAPALEAPAAPHRGAVNDLAQLLFDAWAKAEPEHGVTKHPMSYWASFCDMARTVLAAAPQAPAAPAVDAFTHAELLEIKRAAEEFADCNETDVDYALLLRAAQAGYLECTQFHVLNQSALDLDTVAAAQAKEGGA